MIIGWRCLSTACGLVMAFAVVGCDSGSPSKTRDDIAADSALASDLALANRDTLLVDSIGEYRPPDAAERGAVSTVTTVPPSVTPAPPVETKASVPTKVSVPTKASVPIAKTIAPQAIVAAPPPTLPTPQPVMPAAPAVAAGPARRGAAACNSPSRPDQEECVRATLPGADMRLNRIYRALVTEMRRQENVPRGGGDPASVQRLRVSQRSWLVYRDNQCRRQGRGREGALWARPRVRCLGEFSLRRANELADNFSRLTAH